MFDLGRHPICRTPNFFEFQDTHKQIFIFLNFFLIVLIFPKKNIIFDFQLSFFFYDIGERGAKPYGFRFLTPIRCSSKDTNFVLTCTESLFIHLS